MKNLEISIVYTEKKKKYQISNLYETHFQEPLTKLSDYHTNNGKRSIIGNRLKYLSTWYHWNFIYKFLTDNTVDYSLLAKSTNFALEENNYRYFIGKLVVTYDVAKPFKESMKHLAQMLYLGWNDKAVQYGQLLLKMLYGKHLKGSHSLYNHPWFMLKLFCKWQNIELDYDKLRNPEDLGIYEKALANWNTTDTQLLSEIIDELTAYHINQSNEDEQGGELDENGDGYSLDFTSADYFIFPIEILMWLSIRRIMGLPEYEPSSQNKLMQLEINKLPREAFPYPKDELVEKVKAKLLKENPNIEFELKF